MADQLEMGPLPELPLEIVAPSPTTFIYMSEAKKCTPAGTDWSRGQTFHRVLGAPELPKEVKRLAVSFFPELGCPRHHHATPFPRHPRIPSGWELS